MRKFASPDPDAVINRQDSQALEKIMEGLLTDTSNCIDVGCHAGAVLEKMVRYAPRGQHLAFEPIPELARRLRERFPSVRVCELALSDSTGTAQFFHIINNPALSSLRTHSTYRTPPEIKPIEVETGRLDDLIQSTEHVDFMKVDVEGAELHVLRGGADTIRRCKPHIVFEHNKYSQSFEVSSQMVYDLLVHDFGYCIFSLADWLTNGRPLVVDEFRNTGLFNFIAAPAG